MQTQTLPSPPPPAASSSSSASASVSVSTSVSVPVSASASASASTLSSSAASSSSSIPSTGGMDVGGVDGLMERSDLPNTYPGEQFESVWDGMKVNLSQNSPNSDYYSTSSFSFSTFYCIGTIYITTYRMIIVAHGKDPEHESLSLPLLWFDKDRIRLRRPFFDSHHVTMRLNMNLMLRVEMLDTSLNHVFCQRLVDTLKDTHKVEANSKQFKKLILSQLVPTNVHYAIVDPNNPNVLHLATQMNFPSPLASPSRKNVNPNPNTTGDESRQTNTATPTPTSTPTANAAANIDANTDANVDVNANANANTDTDTDADTDANANSPVTDGNDCNNSLTDEQVDDNDQRPKIDDDRHLPCPYTSHPQGQRQVSDGRQP